eukprot:8598809-Pyramimonas_sp.AAC.1
MPFSARTAARLTIPSAHAAASRSARGPRTAKKRSASRVPSAVGSTPPGPSDGCETLAGAIARGSSCWRACARTCGGEVCTTKK